MRRVGFCPTASPVAGSADRAVVSFFSWEVDTLLSSKCLHMFHRLKHVIMMRKVDSHIFGMGWNHKPFGLLFIGNASHSAGAPDFVCVSSLVLWYSVYRFSRPHHQMIMRELTTMGALVHAHVFCSSSGTPLTHPAFYGSLQNIDQPRNACFFFLPNILDLNLKNLVIGWVWQGWIVLSTWLLASKVLHIPSR